MLASEHKLTVTVTAVEDKQLCQRSTSYQSMLDAIDCMLAAQQIPGVVEIVMDCRIMEWTAAAADLVSERQMANAS